MIDAAVELADLGKTIDELKRSALGDDESVLARDAPVVQNDVVFLSAADGVRLIQVDLSVKGSTGRFCNGKSCVQCIRNCNG